MTEKFTIKYYPNNEFPKVPFQASEDAAGYDLYAAEAKTILPRLCASINLEFKLVILKGYYSRVFARSGVLRDHSVTCDAVVTDADFRGPVSVILINHHCDKHYTVRTGSRIAQVVFMKHFDVKIERIPESGILGKTKRGTGGFGSTGMSELLFPIAPKRTSPILNPGKVFVASDNDD